MKVIDIIFPKGCLVCKKSGEYLCKECKKKLLPHPEICPVTHCFSPDFQVHIDHRRDVSYQGILIGFAYTDILKKLILQLKYYHRYHISSFLAGRLSLVIQTNQALQRVIRHKKTIITSIPSHRHRKYFVKGYNQSELLARQTAQMLGIEYMPLLTKSKSTRSQAVLSRQKRHINLQNAFSLKKNVLLRGDECVIVVDDITTTGSTINEAAKALKAVFPALNVWGAVMGRRL